MGIKILTSILMSLLIPILCKGKELNNLIFEDQAFKALITMKVINGNKIRIYKLDLIVNKDKALIKFIKPKKRLRILKTGSKYWLYFTNSGKLVLTSGSSLLLNSHFKFSDIMDPYLYRNYALVQCKENECLYKRISRKYYPFIKVLFNRNGKVEKVIYMSEKRKPIKVMELKRDERGSLKEIEMKLAFTEDSKTVMKIHNYSREEVPEWKFNPDYLRYWH